MRKTETVAVTCTVCGKKGTVLRQTDRYGKVTEPPTICKDCKQKERFAIYIQQAKAELPHETELQIDKWWDIVAEHLPVVLCDKVINKKWDGFDKKLQPKAYEVVKGFDGHSIILSSPEIYGVGKTYLAWILVNHLIDTTPPVTITPTGSFTYYDCPVFMITETALLAKIRATYNRNRDDGSLTEDEVYNYLSRFELLIIDDVGKVRPRDYSFLQGVYFRIIDDRYNQQQSVMITTNLGPEDLEKHIGGACADRLKEMCGPGNIVVMKGKSYRGSEKETEKREFTAKEESKKKKAADNW